MRVIKFTLIFISLFLYLVLGWLVRLLLLRAKPARRIKTVNDLTWKLMNVFKWIAGIRITVSGHKDILKQRGLFIISTHIGYLDGIVLGTLAPASFTTKNEIRKTPFLGRVVAVGESIFINRHRKNDIIHYIDIMTERLKNQINIFNFPEGHATDGTKILSFFPSFFEAPLKAKVPIVPVAIDYIKVNGRTDFNHDDLYCYDGKTSIISHLWNLMKLKSIEVEVTVLDAVQPNGYQSNSKDRKIISDLCLNRLAARKNLPVSKEHPFINPPPGL